MGNTASSKQSAGLVISHDKHPNALEVHDDGSMHENNDCISEEIVDTVLAKKMRNNGGNSTLVSQTSLSSTANSDENDDNDDNSIAERCKEISSEISIHKKRADSDDKYSTEDGNDVSNLCDMDSSILGCVASPLTGSYSWSNLLTAIEDTTSVSPRRSGKTIAASSFEYTEEELTMPGGDLPTTESNLEGVRDFWIVTTAALPWMTGTAVNPLLRAAYLSQRNRKILSEEHSSRTATEDQTTTANVRSTVTLVIPWLDEASDRIQVYGEAWKDASPTKQEQYIRAWLAEAGGLPEEAALPAQGGLQIQWYPARYHKELSSIFAMGDLCAHIPEDDATQISEKPKISETVCILEEPEHVNFYRAPDVKSFRDRFSHVIGIAHTNYIAYAQNHYSGLLTGPLIGALSSWMVRAYCDKILKLSPVLQTYAPYKEVVSNVHGIRQEFLEIPQSVDACRIYFIGKLLWAKGLDKLLELEASYHKTTGSYFPIDIYGSGPEGDEIKKAFLGAQYQNESQGEFHTSEPAEESSSIAPVTAQRWWRRFRQPIPARFGGRQDHAEVGRNGKVKIFVNPSITEVLCTTTAEAVAMGLWVIIPKHASNEFFLSFRNCVQYSNRQEFVKILQECQLKDPPGWAHSDASTSSTDRNLTFGALSWKTATERFIHTASLSRRDAKRSKRLQKHEQNLQDWHYTLGRGARGDILRKVLGGGPVADQSQYHRCPSSVSLSSVSS